jgi:hypothetical protein
MQQPFSTSERNDEMMLSHGVRAQKTLSLPLQDSAGITPDFSMRRAINAP